MTVEYIQPIIQYQYAGAGTYTFPFRVFEDTDLVLTYTSALGTIETLHLTTDYTVSINDEIDGGSVTIISPVDSGGSLEIKRILQFTQDVALENYGPLDMETIEKVFDKNTMLLQQMNASMAGSIVVSNWRDDWVTGAEYVVQDIVRDPVGGSWYQCFEQHVSDVFLTDVGLGKWKKVVDFQAVIDTIYDAVDVALPAPQVSEIGKCLVVGPGPVLVYDGFILPQPVSADIGRALKVESDLSLAYTGVIPPNPGTGDLGKVCVIDVGPNIVYRNAKDLIASNRNEIIDGDFMLWFEGASQTSSGYGSDTMWKNWNNGTTKIHTRQSFLLGQSSVPGNPKYYSRTVVTSVANTANYCSKETRIEGVDTLSGQTVTLSFYAKADAAKNIAVEFVQNFGTGGSPSTTITGIGAQLIALTTAWTKFTVTVALPSVSGKVAGTNLDDFLGIVFWFDAGATYATRAASLGQQSGTFEIARVRLASGSLDADGINTDYQEVLRRSLRYYDHYTTRTISLFSGNVTTAVQYYQMTNWATTMRAIPGLSATSNASPLSGFANTVGTLTPSIGGVTEYRYCNATGLGVYTTNITADARL